MYLSKINNLSTEKLNFLSSTEIAKFRNSKLKVNTRNNNLTLIKNLD